MQRHWMKSIFSLSLEKQMGDNLNLGVTENQKILQKDNKIFH